MSRKLLFLSFALLLVLACNFPSEQVTLPVTVQVATSLVEASPSPVSPTETPSPVPTATPTVVHFNVPGEPPSSIQWLFDTVSGTSAKQGQPNQPPGGDEYRWNLYERPFNAQTQDTFFPELDITRADITKDDTWLYVTIRLYGPALEPSLPVPAYGVELDLDVDGRGEWLIWARGPYSDTWSTDGVQVYRDTDEDVGEERACRDDPPQDGNSYDDLVFDSGHGDDPDMAWARLLPDPEPRVQLALKYDAIQRDEEFMWWVWTDRGVDQPVWMDYHDHYTLQEAGEPFPARAHYPIKAIAQVDNTCHWVFGFVPTGDEPCVCLGEYATKTPTATAKPKPGRLSGRLYKDRNGNGRYDASPREGVAGIPVEVRRNSCAGPVVQTAVSGDDGGFSFVLEAGTYCVRPQRVSWDPDHYTVTLDPGETISNLIFRLQQ